MAFQGDSIFWVEVEKIVPNPFQPRREFDEQKLRELSESVRMYGILQPLTVTRKEIQREDGTFYTEYELIAGERRLRASKLAGLTQVPVIIREGEDSEQEKLELAIIENLQREDLNAVDRALAFRQLADVFGLSHTQVAKKVGRSREYVSNSIRLLALPDYMLSALRQAEMTEGHARTLLMINDRPEEQDVVFREILLKKLSVREVERIVRKIATDKVRKKHAGEFDAELIEIEKKFMETLGTRVQIQKTDYGGRLTIDYFSIEDLEEMLGRMKNERTTSVSGAAAADLITEHTPLALDDGGRDLADFSDEVLLTDSHVEEKLSQQTVAVPETHLNDSIIIPADNPLTKLPDQVVPPGPEKEQLVEQSIPENVSVISAAAQALPNISTPIVPDDSKEILPNNNNLTQNHQFAPAAISVAESVETVPNSEPAPVVPEKEEDESGLYSIRNFGV